MMVQVQRTHTHPYLARQQRLLPDERVGARPLEHAQEAEAVVGKPNNQSAPSRCIEICTALQ